MTRKNGQKTSNKPHGNTGNKNASKEGRRNKFMQFRVTSDEIKRLKKIARIANVSVSNYIREKIGL